MEPGRVIEFIEGRSFLTSVVTRVKGNKLLILTETDREMSISANRVLHETNPGIPASQPRNEQVRILKEISNRRSDLTARIDLIELWELLEGEGEEFAFDFLAELALPEPVGPDEVAAMRRVIFEDGLYFKMRPDGAQRHDSEKVQQLTLARERERERQRELSEGSEYLAQIWSRDNGDTPPCRERVVRILREMTLYGSEAGEYKWGQKLLSQAGLGGDPWKPFHLLVKMGEMDYHENLDLIREQIPTEFSAQALAEAETIAKEMTCPKEGRMDLTGLQVITADSSGARDFDDAISLEDQGDHLVLGVHIADVSAVIEPGMLIDHEAMERSSSIYMPDRRIPMLPEILSEECLSLKAGVVRPAFSLLAELTPEGKILDFEFTPSLIQVKRQLSYQEVDTMVEHDLILSRMFQLSLALKARRAAQGALILPLPKLNIFITPDGEIGVNLTQWENPGRSMISEFMILANHLAAQRLTDVGMPCLYRCQSEPSQRTITDNTDCRDLFPCLQQRRYLNRVSWEFEANPHHGMGLAVYTNLTSPLRRYVDLIIQRQIRSVSRSGVPFYTEDAMKDLFTIVETAQRKATRIQMKRRRYWLLRYLEIAGHENHEALVLEKLPRRWRIFLTDLMVDADLPRQTGLDLEPGETIMVRVKKVSPREDILKFVLT